MALWERTLERVIRRARGACRQSRCPQWFDSGRPKAVLRTSIGSQLVLRVSINESDPLIPAGEQTEGHSELNMVVEDERIPPVFPNDGK